MKTRPIPVRVVGGSSQADEKPLQCRDVPRDPGIFRTPAVSPRAGAEALSEARAVLAEFVDALGPWDPRLSRVGPRLDVSGVSPAALALVDQMLGEGKVSIQIGGVRPIRVQESVFTGVWRVRAIDAAGALDEDWIEAATLPEAVIDAALSGTVPAPLPVRWREGAINSPALLEEIRRAMRACTPETPAHVVNLTLSPMTSEDDRVLELALPAGPVTLSSRDFGNCRITSTLGRNVWRVQYFDSVGTLTLNTIEVVCAPEGARATAEDLHNSRERLEDLIIWIGEDIAA